MKVKLSKSNIILSLLLLFVSVSLITVLVSKTSKYKPDSNAVVDRSTSTVKPVNTFSESKLLEFTNSSRSAISAVPLILNAQLSNAAMVRCSEFVSKNYWSNADPSGNEPWQYVKDQGYTYDKIATNTAYGYSNGSEIVQGWMNNPTNKANILDAKFTETGIGVCEGPNFLGKGKQTIVVQYLATPAKGSSPPSTATTSVPNSYASNKTYTAPLCVTVPIPYKTVYKNVNYLNVGQTNSAGGTDGSLKTCSADSTGYKPMDITYPAYDKTIYVGTYTPTSYPIAPTRISYQTALGNCARFGDSSAYEQCLRAYGY